METKNLSLFELPGILFHQFLAHLGVTEIENFKFNYKGEKIACRSAYLPRQSSHESPTLVFIDRKEIFGQTKLALLSHSSVLQDKETDDVKNYANISVETKRVSENVFNLSLIVNLPISGYIDIGDPNTKFSSGYLRELHERADELFRSKSYDWVTQYKK